MPSTNSTSEIFACNSNTIVIAFWKDQYCFMLSGQYILSNSRCDMHRANKDAYYILNRARNPSEEQYNYLGEVDECEVEEYTTECCRKLYYV
ncbi:hypothetical protein DPMN_161206 [Dreissena polymorpha]|uniref:Uncharacterized protein n=1 Tax=Dreissena polymorpha TaxID=45954 RepID=A0A9D4ESQ3_DREPO|nr:hypothetical protein DPMN_161206 [Dreissena polymorpha]